MSDKTAVSLVVEVEPCLSYNFVVESVEKETFSTDRRETKAAEFASRARPKVNNNGKGRGKSQLEVNSNRFWTKVTARSKCTN